MFSKFGRNYWNHEMEPCVLHASAMAPWDGSTEQWQGKNSAAQSFKKDTQRACERVKLLMHRAGDEFFLRPESETAVGRAA